jgi:ATP-binding cassette, subfamily B, bacterial
LLFVATSTFELNNPLAALQMLLPFVRPYWRRLAWAVFGLTLAVAATLAIGEGVKRVVDQGFLAQQRTELDTILFAMIGLAIVQGVGVFIRYMNISWVNQRVVGDVRKKCYDHLLTLSPAYFERTRVGDVISRLSSDISVLDSIVSNSFSLALQNVIMVIGAFVMLGLTSVKLLVFVLIATPVVALPLFWLGRKVQVHSRLAQDKLADAMARADEAIHAMRTVQAYTQEALERRAFAQRIHAFFVDSTKRHKASALLVATNMALAFAGVSVILWVGGQDVLAGKMTAGQLSAFVFYSIMIASAVGAITEAFGQMKRATGATERIRELLTTSPAIQAPAHPTPLPPPRGEIVFDSVTFRYPTRPDIDALDDFSVRVRPGELIALVGPSGAGKSTVFQLLLRFYDTGSGSVRVDGVDVRAATPADLRSRIALVSQDPVIFSGSVADNVRYGRLDASDAEVSAACDAAHVTEFALALPQGMETELGERGVRLSGGQRQRVAIARAILSDRPILLLDEATSALDSESEALVTDALERLAHEKKNRTTLVIAHRLSTVQSADRIVVIEAGKVVAQGTHAELMEQSALYQRLAARQFAAV